MRRSLLLLIAGCGRLGFGTAAEDASVVAPDTAVDCTTLPDGTTCDDRNICTASSTCQAGVCGAAMVTGCQVADSQVEFGDTQGENGWFYGFWNAADDTTYEPADLELGVFDTGAWIPMDPFGSAFIYLRDFGVHPQFDPKLRMPVRRWVSDVQGPAIVIVDVSKADTSCGDGVEARLAVDGAIVMTQPIASDDGVGFTIPVAVELVPGTKLDALLSPLAGEACDTTDYKLVVTSAPTN